MKVKKVKIPIYFRELVIIKAKCLTSLNKKYKVDIKKDSMGAVMFRHKDKYIVAFQKSDISGSLIAHESVHIVNAVFEDIRANLDIINDEPQAYLTGWIFEQIENALKN